MIFSFRSNQHKAWNASLSSYRTSLLWGFRGGIQPHWTYNGRNKCLSDAPRNCGIRCSYLLLSVFKKKILFSSLPRSLYNPCWNQLCFLGRDKSFWKETIIRRRNWTNKASWNFPIGHWSFYCWFDCYCWGISILKIQTSFLKNDWFRRGFWTSYIINTIDNFWYFALWRKRVFGLLQRGFRQHNIEFKSPV